MAMCLLTFSSCGTHTDAVVSGNISSGTAITQGSTMTYPTGAAVNADSSLSGDTSMTTTTALTGVSTRSTGKGTTVKRTTAAGNTTVATVARTTAEAASGTVMNFRKSGDKNTLGVWWWRINTITGSAGQMYLDFCVQNHVSEIYLCVDGMRESSGTTFATVRSFVKKAHGLGIRVAALTGDYEWIEPTNTGFQSFVSKYTAYQNAAASDEKFYAMHLDVEPHQHPDFGTERAKVLQWYADFTVNKATAAAKTAGALLEFDIPFWFNDTVTDAGTGNRIGLNDLMAKYCDTIVIMSYRDTAQSMHDVSKEEIASAKKYGCKIVLGAETYSTEGDAVSYMEEGKKYMVSELTKLNIMLLQDYPSRNFGLAIHYNETWYQLKN